MNMLKCFPLVLMIAAVVPDESEITGEEEPEDVMNCSCQCMNLTYEKRGEEHGNCETVYDGDYWCYVIPEFSNCEDLKDSRRYSGQKWSYKACSSPKLSSPACQRFVGGDRYYGSSPLIESLVSTP